MYFFVIMDDKNKFLTWLQKFPVWVRICILLLIAALAFFATMSSSACGQISKVTVQSTTAGVEIRTNQNKRDSMSTNINVNPTIYHGVQPSLQYQ